MDLDEDETLYTKKLIQPSRGKIRIVLCGSKQVQGDMLKIAHILNTLHFNVITPRAFIDDSNKYMTTMEHFSQIIYDETYGILVINNTAYGQENYIGASTFADIAFAAYYNKQIYLLNNIYEPYKEELDNWKIKCCDGKLNKLIIDTL